MQASPSRLLAAAVAFGLGFAGRAVAQASSPFLPAPGSDPAVAAPTENIEFSGVVIGKKTLIILYDKVAKKSRHISLGDTIDGISVLAYDARRDQVVVKVGGEQKLLTLRKATGIANAGTPAPPALNPAMNFNLPAPAPVDVVQKIQPPPPSSAPAVAETPVAAAPAAHPAKPDAPVTPPTIAKQEEEARMLVSDLLEIGMAQRKAYEEKQKQAAGSEQNAASTPPPAPTPVPNNGG